MKLKHLSPIFLLTSSVWLWCAVSATAEQVTNSQTQSQSIASVLHQSRKIREIPQLSKIKPLSTSAQMLVQSPVPSEMIQVIGVEANPTENGVEVILQTTQGEQLQITNRSEESNFIADIPNAQLRLPSGDAFTFSSQNPLNGISEITVTNLDANTIRVTVAGETGLPTVELFDSNEGLIFALTPATTATQSEPEQPTSETPSAEADEPIELVVTGEQDGYRVPDASVGTRTDTPLRDIPQSIQVIPQEVLRDQNVTRLEEALKNVPGVTRISPSTLRSSTFNIRGFAASGPSGNYLRNGLRDILGQESLELSNIERVEVLKGPASVLYGTGTPGGTINLVTKEPLHDPSYTINATIGNYDFYRGAIDLSGPLNDSRTVLYRLNASYQDRNENSCKSFLWYSIKFGNFRLGI
ncbi:MAG: TonB-dependent receptor plug domain-containing protein [Trichormus sp. ATA11-4-KO1]|jgi:iron complex outermembrane receptor protein|nr:TonB-dependent receptor plug domain-containing protein [Trichormus sp. ATA11-4-KO1]